jgi:protocadherin-16/23
LSDSEVLRVIAVDKDAGDNGRVSYVISSGNEDGYFSIAYNTGLIKLVKPLIHPTVLEITANDHGIQTRKAVIKLTMTPCIEQKNNFPRLLIPNLIARISENFHVGTNIISVAGSALSNHGKCYKIFITYFN